MGFDLPEDKEFIDKTCDIFRSHGGEAYFVELAATLMNDCGVTRQPFVYPRNLKA